MKKLLFTITAIATLHATEHDVVILGGGMAGLTAAVQASQAGLDTVIISGPTPGGIITESHSVQNWPGEIEISGSALADQLQKQVDTRGVQSVYGCVVAVDVSKRPFQIQVQKDGSNTQETILAKTCIIALGAKPKLLNVPGETENLFTRIFTCAPCDGLRFKQKTVAVIGGGDSALTEAHYLSNLAKKVYVLVRKGQFKTVQSEKQKAILALPNIEVLYDASVEAFEKPLDQDLVLQLKTSSGPKLLKVQGAFLAIGSLPNTDLFKGQLELDAEGYIMLKNQQETSIKGIFAAGDVSDRIFRQAMTAAGDATKAALQAQMVCNAKPLQKPSQPSAVSLKEASSLQAFHATLTTAKKPTIAYFYSEGCPPCRQFRPIYQSWSEQFRNKANFIKVSAENAIDCFEQYHISQVPTIVIFDEKGKEIYRGGAPNDLQEIQKQIEKIR
jgi:thioredoxin reductase (NADPH)